MRYIKNGKVVLDGTMTEQELEDKLFATLEVIINKKVNIALIEMSHNVSYYNFWKKSYAQKLLKKEFKAIKEIM